VLPDLIAAYTIERDWLHAGFDPVAVARAELAWWVARRVPGQNSAEQVGALIPDENALLYEVPRDRVLEASTVRARRQIARRRRRAGGLGDGVRLAAPVVSRAARGGAVSDLPLI